MKPKLTFAFQIRANVINEECSEYGGLWSYQSSNRTQRDILHMSDGGGGNKGGRQRGSHGGSGRIKAKDGGRVLSPAVQLR